jgi:hypothetical protein
LPQDDCRANVYKHLTTSSVHTASFNDPDVDIDMLTAEAEVTADTEAWTVEEHYCVSCAVPN